MAESDSDHIELRCVACCGSFSVPASLAGKTERCPHCAAMNDIPLPGDAAELLRDFDPGQSQAGNAAPKLSLVWTIISLLAAVGFATVVWYIYRPTWERRNADHLLETYKQAEADFRGGEFAKAQAEYQSILNTVDDRQLKSEVLRQLVHDSREHEAQAKAEMQKK